MVPRALLLLTLLSVQAGAEVDLRRAIREVAARNHLAVYLCADAHGQTADALPPDLESLLKSCSPRLYAIPADGYSVIGYLPKGVQHLPPRKWPS
jgi:hypothetical protein